MASWLYPVANRKDKNFELIDEERPVTPETFKELVYNGRIAEDNVWGIAFNFTKIQIND